MAKRPEPNPFVAKVLGLLTHFGDVRARAMFGGHGIYLDGVMFGLIAKDRLYFKTDAETRPHFDNVGSKPFTFRNSRGTVSTSYYEPPKRAVMTMRSLMPWAELGIIAARNSAQGKRAEGKIAKAGRRPRKAVVKSRS
jgi:DNA transformation protein